MRHYSAGHLIPQHAIIIEARIERLTERRIVRLAKSPAIVEERIFRRFFLQSFLLGHIECAVRIIDGITLITLESAADIKKSVSSSAIIQAWVERQTDESSWPPKRFRMHGMDRGIRPSAPAGPGGFPTADVFDSACLRKYATLPPPSEVFTK
jgi:hypothetical protein